MSEGFYFENLEEIEEYNIPRGFWEGRPFGLSAFVRVKNEGDFLEYAIESIVDWHDEVCLFLQGEQEDATPVIASRLAAKYPDKVKVFEYPFESVANGPGHHLQVRGSLHERAYFYNWCLSKTTYSYVDKWDGDMIGFPELGPKVRKLMEKRDGIYFPGLDLVGRDLRYESKKRSTANEMRVHKLSDRSFYFTYNHCEHNAAVALPGFKYSNIEKLSEFGYIHLKWCKSSLKFSGVGWPDDWMTSHPYYREIFDNKKAAKLYRGEYPPAIKPYLKSLKARA
jgi:glycosyltransferase involved in cell wall biosynthesis